MENTALETILTFDGAKVRSIDTRGIGLWGIATKIPPPESIEEAMYWGRMIGKRLSNLEGVEIGEALNLVSLMDDDDHWFPAASKLALLASIFIGFESESDDRNSRSVAMESVFRMTDWWGMEEFSAMVSAMRILHGHMFWSDNVERDMAKEGAKS